MKEIYIYLKRKRKKEGRIIKSKNKTRLLEHVVKLKKKNIYI